MPEKDLLLKDFKPRSALTTESNIPERAKFPVIDAHNHLGYHEKIVLPFYYGQSGWLMPDVSKGLALMDELNIRVVVNLDGAWGDQLKINLERYRQPYPDRFAVFTGLDWTKVNERDFGEKSAKKIDEDVKAGAQGLKIWRTLGLEHRDLNGKLIRPDDPKLDPVWAKAGELGIPILIHVADPVAFFWPLDETNERYDELKDIPEAHWYDKDYPQHIELIEALLHVVERHPNTTFIGAHVLSYSENLKYVGEALTRFPNLYVDIGERIGELGRQPYSARKFIIDYQDRVVFGVDIPNHKKTYQTYFRALETQDEYFDYGRMQGRYCIYGLYLPDDVLMKIYHKNALKLIPGLKI
jgi:predicted TIM-barrel fold metal-dependent hydrolase